MHRGFYNPWRQALLEGGLSWPNQTHDLLLLSPGYGFNVNHKSLDQIPPASVLARATIPNRSVSGSCLFADGVLIPGASVQAGQVSAMAIYNVEKDILVLFNSFITGRNIQTDGNDLSWEWAECGIACYCEGAD